MYDIITSLFMDPLYLNLTFHCCWRYITLLFGRIKTDLLQTDLFLSIFDFVIIGPFDQRMNLNLYAKVLLTAINKRDHWNLFTNRCFFSTFFKLSVVRIRIFYSHTITFLHLRLSRRCTETRSLIVTFQF